MRCFLAPIVGAILLTSPALAQPLTTAFTYQGNLTSAAAPANGTYDLRFRLYDAPNGGAQQGPTLCSDNVNIAAGAFSVLLDFGAQYSGQRRWIEIDVRQDAGLNCTDSAGFTTLGPRQELTATPNASFAANASSAGTATNAANLNNQPPSFYSNAANLTAGTIPSARVSGSYTNPLTLSNASNSFTGSFSGSGSGLTSVPFASLTGVPATVSLQSTTPGTVQTGNLNLSGKGLFSGIGIGTSTPDTNLHVFRASAGTITASANAPLAVENNANCYMNILAPDANETGLLFGRPGSTATNAAGGIIFNNAANPDGLTFRTGGNLSRMTIDSAGNVGIGTIAPESDLHVFRASAGAITPHPGAPLVVENNASCYINILAPDASETGIFFGRPGLANIAGSILYNSAGHPDALIFRTNNLSRMAIDNSGNVGIGTINPTAKLHVVGSSSDVILPASSITASEIADEPGVACSIPHPSGLWTGIPDAGVSVSRTISCPSAGYVLATASFTVLELSLSDTSFTAGLTDNVGIPLASNEYQDTVLAHKYRTVTVHGLFTAAAGNKTVWLNINPNDLGHEFSFSAAHLTLVFIPTAYGTANTDQ